MAGSWKWSLLCLVAGLSLAGCAAEVVQGNNHEQRGEYWLAYDQYLEAVAKNPGDAAATAGLRRTSNLAASYWEAKAFEAATQRKWDAACEYHMKVLRIKPNESSSVLSLRQIAQYRSEAEGLEEPVLVRDVPQAEPPAAPRRDSARFASALPVFRGARARMSPMERPPVEMHLEYLPVNDITVHPAFALTSIDDLPDLAEAVMPVSQLQGEAITLGMLHPDIDPARGKPAKQVFAPVAQAAPVPAGAVATAPKPAIEQKPPKFADTFTKRFSIKLEGKRYQRRMYFDNGLTVQLSDTDMSPPDVDMEIHLNGRFLASYMDLTAGSIVVAHDKHGEAYEIGIIGIEDAGQKVIFGIRKKAAPDNAQLAGK